MKKAEGDANDDRAGDHSGDQPGLLDVKMIGEGIYRPIEGDGANEAGRQPEACEQVRESRGGEGAPEAEVGLAPSGQEQNETGDREGKCCDPIDEGYGGEQ